MYDQINYVAMGSPSRYSVGNIFIYALERKFLDNFSSEFKRILYRRCADDTFVFVQ